MRIIISLIFIILFGNSATLRADSNPFKEGTELVTLNKTQQEELLQFIDTAKELLEKALREAKGKTLDEAKDIYLSSIKTVVRVSYQKSPRAQLLMRIALNQALELTYGIPSKDGGKVLKQGVLAKLSNQDLLAVILEDSIKLAIHYYKDDRQAVKEGSLLSLPYLQFAYKRLVVARLWMAGVTEGQLAYLGILNVLGHWHTVVTRADQKHKGLFAKEILKIDQFLTVQAALSLQVGSLATGEKLREARGKLSWLFKRLSKRWKDVGLPVDPTPAIAKLFDPNKKPEQREVDFEALYDSLDYPKDPADLEIKIYGVAHDKEEDVGSRIGVGFKLSGNVDFINRGKPKYKYIRGWLDPRAEVDFEFEPGKGIRTVEGDLVLGGIGFGVANRKAHIVLLPLWLDAKFLKDEQLKTDLYATRFGSRLDFGVNFHRDRGNWKIWGQLNGADSTFKGSFRDQDAGTKRSYEAGTYLKMQEKNTPGKKYRYGYVHQTKFSKAIFGKYDESRTFGAGDELGSYYKFQMINGVMLKSEKREYLVYFDLTSNFTKDVANVENDGHLKLIMGLKVDLIE